MANSVTSLHILSLRGLLNLERLLTPTVVRARAMRQANKNVMGKVGPRVTGAVCHPDPRSNPICRSRPIEENPFIAIAMVVHFTACTTSALIVLVLIKRIVNRRSGKENLSATARV